MSAPSLPPSLWTDFVCNKLLSHEPLAAAMTGLGLQAADAQSMADTDLFTM